MILRGNAVAPSQHAVPGPQAEGEQLLLIQAGEFQFEAVGQVVVGRPVYLCLRPEAVALCLYEMARDPKAAVARPGKIRSATAGETEQITSRLLEALSKSGYVNPVTAAPQAANSTNKARVFVDDAGTIAREEVLRKVDRQLLDAGA